MLIDGRKIAQEIKEGLEKKVARLSFQPKLGIVYVGENKAIDQFLKIKKNFGESIGVEVNIYRYPVQISETELIAEIKKTADLNDGLIVQLPLPEDLLSDKVLAAVPIEKDVDALTKESFFESPVLLTVRGIFSHFGISLRNRTVAVVGEGRLVGQPIVKWLREENIQPIILNKQNPDFSKLAKADIIISGAGSPALIKKEMIKAGAILIDAGTSELDGKTAGDIDSGAYSKASLYTPVPGGLGPITVANLYENLLKNL